MILNPAAEKAGSQAVMQKNEFSVSGYHACSTPLQNGKTLTIIEEVENIYIIEYDDKLFNLTEVLKVNNYIVNARIRKNFSFYSIGSPWSWYSDYYDGFMLKAADTSRNVYAVIFTAAAADDRTSLIEKQNTFISIMSPEGKTIF